MKTVATIYTDASTTLGYGFYNETSGDYGHGLWRKTPGWFHGQEINSLEFWVVVFALKLCHEPHWRGKRVEILCDNDTTVKVISHGYTNKERLLFPLISVHNLWKLNILYLLFTCIILHYVVRIKSHKKN